MPLCFSSAGTGGCQCRKEWQTQIFVQGKPCHFRNALMTVVEARHLKCLRHNGASSCHTDNVASSRVLIDLASAYTEMCIITRFSCSLGAFEVFCPCVS